MDKVSILDCTLRDGGYCNQWKFGYRNIKKIMNALANAGVDIIECGFLTEKIVYDENISKYSDLQQIANVISRVESNQKIVAMINYGEYDINHIDCRNEAPIDGIRLAFHKKDRYDAIRYCRNLSEKGYDVFIQPMVTMNYTQEEFIELIDLANDIGPYAFYIVDSFGTMRKKDLDFYYKILDAYLKKEIKIGFHSHNNFQFAFANAMALVEKPSEHELIIDTSVYGMGRGAGNLNTELFANELNLDKNRKYDIKPLIRIMDEVLNRFYDEKPWGYSFPNYLSASYMIHPNYATFLCEKNTLTIDAIDDIFSMLEREKAVEFDGEYIEQIYEQYMSKEKVNDERLEEFQNDLQNKKILLIAPGKSAAVQSEKIKSFIEREHPIVISINHEYKQQRVDYVFVSNMRRFEEIPSDINIKLLTTSNIKTDKAYMSFDYYSLLNEMGSVKDNAGLMAIELIKKIHCDELWLAGYDGYDYISSDNYETNDLVLVMNKHQIDEINSGMRQALKRYSEKMQLHFLTKTRLVE